ncbi:DUF2061 domain-containing protein [Patescibacteria group bacterium]|nr:DUF2061 domain-containing protein [Patescibacteria group bacterium]MBU1029169.1 DUF2061 domain-containing protein [Patescibacteria group bacterium]MBU1916153.1 DUF2061 domain-containing protein [Patescibacteria group bacterium]
MPSNTFSKAVIFRVVVVTIDLIILYFVLGSFAAGGAATLIRHVIQILMYWYHERVWGRHPWGIVKGVETSRRALVKTITFRLFTSGKDLFVILLFTGEMERGLIGMLLIALTNSIVYFVFERVWVLRK